MRILPLPARRELMTAEASVRGLHCAEASYPAGMRLGVHAHEHASITVIAQGGVVELDHRGRPTQCEPGRVIVRPAGDAHANHVGRAGVVNVEVDLAPAVLQDHGACIRVPRIVMPPSAAEVAARLRRALSCRDGARSLLVESAALEIVALALYTSDYQTPSAALRHAHERIRLEFRDKLSMRALAHEAGMHPVSFARAFRARYRTSPGELLRRLRLEWAAQELRRRPEASIAQIALEAGFYDQSHFARAFAARFGRPPARYRHER